MKKADIFKNNSIFKGLFSLVTAILTKKIPGSEQYRFLQGEQLLGKLNVSMKYFLA